MSKSLPSDHLNLLDLFARGELARKRSQYIIAESQRLHGESRALRAALALSRLRLREVVQMALALYRRRDTKLAARPDKGQRSAVQEHSHRRTRPARTKK